MDVSESIKLPIDLVALALNQIQDSFAVLLLCLLNHRFADELAGLVVERENTIIRDTAG